MFFTVEKQVLETVFPVPPALVSEEMRARKGRTSILDGKVYASGKLLGDCHFVSVETNLKVSLVVQRSS